MELGISLSQGLEMSQSLCLSQTIDFARLMSIPDEVLRTVVGAVSYNPNMIESKIISQKEGGSSRFFDASTKVKTIYGSLIPSKGDSEYTKCGTIMTPDLRGLEGCLGNYNTMVSADVTYVGRKEAKPELVLSDHLKGSMRLSVMPLDSSIYPETSRLLDRLISFDSWKRDILMKAYVVIGGKQREYMEEFDKAKFNIFNQGDLANELDIDHSTVSRLISNRWAEIRNISGGQQFLYIKDLLPTKDDLKRYISFKKLNGIMREEFDLGRAYSDREICEENAGLARRTITKYRDMNGIPGGPERNLVYKNGSRKEAFVFE